MIFAIGACSTKKNKVETMLPETSKVVLERAQKSTLKVDEKIAISTLDEFVSKRSVVAYQFSLKNRIHLYFNHTEINNLKSEDRAPLEYFDYGPTIAIKNKKSLKFFDLRAQLMSYYWVGVFADSKFDNIWGVLDLAINSKEQNFLLIQSSDQGESWALIGSIPKPKEDVALEEFKIYKSGKLEILLSRRYDEEGSLKGREVYRGVSLDLGRSWVLGEADNEISLEAPSPSASREGSCESLYPWPGERIAPACLIPLPTFKEEPDSH